MYPGCTAFTRMPKAPSSIAAERRAGEALSRFGHVDSVFANAGIAGAGTAATTTRQLHNTGYI